MQKQNPPSSTKSSVRGTREMPALVRAALNKLRQEAETTPWGRAEIAKVAEMVRQAQAKDSPPQSQPPRKYKGPVKPENLDK